LSEATPRLRDELILTAEAGKLSIFLKAMVAGVEVYQQMDDGRVRDLLAAGGR
jgi:hypothetical protein